MKYLRLAADWGRVNLVDANGARISASSAGLSDQLDRKISDWNERYEYIIQLDGQHRSHLLEAIHALDVEGFGLCDDIESETGAKVEYYSEGLLRRLMRSPKGDAV